MDDESIITHKSQILTNHIRKSKSLLNLPSIQLSSNRKGPSSISHIPTFAKARSQPQLFTLPQKTRQLLIREQRSKNLLKLKSSLNKKHMQHLQLMQSLKPRQIIEEDMTKRIQQKLNKIICIKQKGYWNEEQIIKDEIFLQFQRYCLPIIRVHEVFTTLNDKRFKIKVERLIEQMKNRLDFQKIIFILANNGNIIQLYDKYRHKFIRDPIFYREIKILGLQTMYMIEHYQNNRHQYLSNNIKERTTQLQNQRLQIGSKLQKVETFNIRKNIYKALQKIQFQCMANRYYYQEFTERIKNKEIYL